ncbi:MAG: hypothetical protein ACRDKT_08135 [Actinomycetota bacterium]
MLRLLAASAAVAVALLGAAAPAHAQSADCSRVAIVTLPGVTWADVQRSELGNIDSLAASGAIGSLSVRTVSSQTTYASGFTTIGAGTRMDGGDSTGGVIDEGAPDELLRADIRMAGLDEIETLAEEAGYEAVPGALTAALDGIAPVAAVGTADPGIPPPVPLGFGRWAHLAAMDPDGIVARGTDETVLRVDMDAPYGVRTDRDTLVRAMEQALGPECGVTIIDHGDVLRADQASAVAGEPVPQRDAALEATDDIVGRVVDLIDPERDLVLVLSPTSPGWDPETHLGVMIASGPGFPAGSSVVSGSTRADGIVTLPDVAPTVLAHLGVDRPASMLGTAISAVPWNGSDRIAAAIELDEEAVYSHGIQADIATGFVIVQVLIYILIIVLLLRTEREGLVERPRLRRRLELGALSVVAFPLASYLASPLSAHEIGLTWLVVALVAIVAALVTVVSILISVPLYRLAALAAATLAVMTVDLAFGGPLQFMAVFGNDPINAGRFAGLGNIAFAIFGTCSVLTASILFHRWPDKNGVLVGVALLFVVTVIADGAPQLGSDVGGVLALVPALVVTFLLLAGKRPSWRIVAFSVLAALVALGLFLALDLARPSEEQTHLGRFFSDVRARGVGVFLDTIERKARTNLRIFGSTIWTYLVPPALALIAYLLLRPSGRWHTLAVAYPRLRAGLIGGLLLGVLGFAVNDSGIVVPAMVLSFLVPMALLIHLSIDESMRSGTG